ncbi:MAG: UvrD-helicase domain-containing protein [Bacteroidota bacterium]
MPNKNFTVYRSSAGSGKTFTLVKEYLKLALSDEADPPRRFRHILAITFTNKAAAEMKERIIRMLKDISDADRSVQGSARTMLEQIAAETGRPRHEITAKAEKVLQAILHNYSDFAIGTIDSFIHSIIRTFAHDLHIPLNFEIEMDEQKLLSQVIDVLVSRIGSDDKLTRMLVAFAEDRADDEMNWHIESSLNDFALNLLKEDGIAHLERIKTLTLDDFAQIRETLVKERRLFETRIQQQAQKAHELIRSSGLRHEAFYQAGKGISAWFEKLANGNMLDPGPNSYVHKTVAEDKWHGGKSSAEEKQLVERIKPALAEAYQAICSMTEREYPRYVLFGLIYRNIYPLAVLNEIEKLLLEYKKENNILHISEFNRIISGIVLSQPVPFIYERIGEKYNHYLLDEFQDTSVMQWHNLLPLIENSLAGNHFNMIVGDGKQAIYRWRGGEVEQFARLPELIAKDGNPILLEREQALRNHFIGRTLSGNFRSKAEIVDFNNRFFRFVASTFREETGHVYGSPEQEFDPKNTGGLVTLEFLEKEEEKALSRTLSLIHELLEDGFEPGDIALLVRSNKEGALLAGFLSANHVPVVSSESLLLKYSPEINFVLAFLQFVNDPADSIAKASLLNYLAACGKVKEPGRNTLLQLAGKDTAAFREYLVREGYRVNTYYLAKMPLYELCEEAIRLFGLKNGVYLRFFLEEVLAYTTRFSNNLGEFLDWWSERQEQASVIVSESMNAVNILTIHKSKGLEFPAVIMPFANWKMSKGKRDIWIHPADEKIQNLGTALVPLSPQLERTAFGQAYREEKSKAFLDNINVLYVAMTRAAERLYMLTSPPQPLKDLSRLFISYLEHEGSWDSARTVYNFGEKSPRVKKPRAGTRHFAQAELVAAGWREKLKIRTSSADVWESEGEEKKTRGLLLHYALSKIKTREDIPQAVHAMLAEGMIGREEAGALIQRITSLLDHEEIGLFFDGESDMRSESDIILPGGEVLRPDRVIIRSDKVIVLDYKTGKADEKYKTQLGRYVALLGQMGFGKVEGYLVYTAEGRLERAV